jgi:hypothetical protein
MIFSTLPVEDLDRPVDGRSFQGPDGHLWELWMDSSALERAPAEAGATG